VCATDVKAILKGHIVFKPPRVLGHEIAGHVVEVNGTSCQAVGNRVVVAPYVPCGHCYFCYRNEETMCENLWDAEPDPGGFAEYVRCPAPLAERGLIPIPAGLSSTVASLAEAIACAIRAVRDSHVTPGSCVVVVGDGPMGMINAAVARAYGAGPVILSGMVPHRLEIAARHYADITVDISQEKLEEVVKETMDGHGADVVIVTVPAVAAVRQGMTLARRGGTVNVFAGQPNGSIMELDLATLHYNELNITGNFGSSSVTLHEALRLAASGWIDFAPIVTREFALAELMKAVDYSVAMEGLRSVVVME
jgi:L-iditol 2-dehydrogenase